MRIACGLAYEGTHYAGWQWQPHVPTIQEKVEAAISQVARHDLRIISAGRTDRGVHASHQIMHFDTPCQRSNETWQRAINYYLPSDIRILWVKPVENYFHARHSAEHRTYCYRIYQGNLPWHKPYSLVTHKPLQLDAMQLAARMLVGQHDFSAFRAAQCQAASPIRHIYQLTLSQQALWIQLEVTANGFLHHMVRNIVGVLVEVGQQKRTAQSMQALLASRDRRKASITAPPQGLYLTSIGYPQRFNLPIEYDKHMDTL